MKRILSFIALFAATVTLIANPVTGSSTDYQADQGLGFGSGYNYTFAAVDGEVTISFEFLETYEGLVVFFWNYTAGFSEKQMTLTGQTATITLHNQAAGKELDFACKIAYAGGMSVTKHFQFTVPAYEGGGSSESTTIYWSDFLADGAADGLYANKYKVQDMDGVGVVNIQAPAFAASQPGIYITFPLAVSTVSISGAAIEGAGVLIPLSSLTNEYTMVTVTCADGTTYTFQIYYADGVKATALRETTATSQAVKALENGHIIILHNGLRFDPQGKRVR